MSRFTDFLTITQTSNWRRWRLESPLVYEVGQEGSGREVAVPRGFVTDGASIPRPLWWLLPTWGTYSRAAVVHDYLYVLLNDKTPHKHAADRKTADAIFLEAMRVSGVTKIVRTALWLICRLFGGITIFKKLVVN